MDFLINYAFDENDIREISDANHKSLINNVILNKKNIIEIIEYLLELGVNNDTIKKLFIYQIGVFYKTKKELIEAFDEYEMESIVKSLNYDVNTFDMIEF